MLQPAPIKPIRVGLHFRSYGYGHTTFLNKPEGVEYVRAWDPPLHKFTLNPSLINNHLFSGPPGLDIFHTWNGIVANRRPWVVSFESYMPRYSGSITPGHWLYKWGVRRLKSRWCKALLPACEVARRQLEAESWFDEDMARKTRLHYYAVERVEPARIDKQPRQVKILFVGHEFFRKGGHLLVDAFERIHPKYPRLSLEIVSRVDSGDYFTHASPSKAREYIDKMAQHPAISHKTSVENDRLLRELLPSADIYAYPTLDDTFAITPMEALSVGLPVIATDIRAIPEMIEDGVEGELISVKKNSLGVMTDYGPDAESHITRELMRIMSKWAENPEMVKKMGAKAVKKWERKFSSKQRAKQLKELYESVLRGGFPPPDGRV